MISSFWIVAGIQSCVGLGLFIKHANINWTLLGLRTYVFLADTSQTLWKQTRRSSLALYTSFQPFTLFFYEDSVSLLPQRKDSLTCPWYVPAWTYMEDGDHVYLFQARGDMIGTELIKKTTKHLPYLSMSISYKDSAGQDHVCDVSSWAESVRISEEDRLNVPPRILLQACMESSSQDVLADLGSNRVCRQNLKLNVLTEDGEEMSFEPAATTVVNQF